jgi:hypothetical protein
MILALRQCLARLTYDWLRSLGFVPEQRDGRHCGWPGELCDHCGRRNVTGFLVDDAVWMAVVGNTAKVWCATCFDEEAQRKAIAYTFREVSPVTWSDWDDFLRTH